MSLFGSIFGHAKAQFLDVIEWLEDDQQVILYKYPAFNQAIQDSSKLVVRTGQSAIFQAEGTVSDAFAPGTYELNTRTPAVWGFFQSIKYGLNYPYKGDVFFVSTRRFTDQRWGTPSPLPMRDPEFGMVQLRANGNFSYRVVDSVKFLTELVGNRGVFTTNEINGELRQKLVSTFADTLGESKIPFLDLVSQYSDLGEVLRERMNPSFVEDYGIELLSFNVGSITLPPEVQEMMNKMTSMNMVGGKMQQYAQFQAINSMESMSERPGGSNTMMDAGMGLAMGNVMGGMMGQAMGGAAGPMGGHPPAAAAPPPPPAAPTYHYNGPSGQAQLSAQQIAQRVSADRSANHMVWANGWPAWRAWGEVPEISGLVPPAAAPPPPAETTFHYHGPSGQQQLTVSAIAEKVKADPDASHMVWKDGFASWTAALEVPEIKSAMSAGGPPPPPVGGPPAPPM